MLGSLNKWQIEGVLHKNLVGRIGFYGNKKIFIVPVTYVFDGKAIYVQSREGLKIELMRKDPEVCFEVDDIDNMANWRSVIVWGKYEELKTKKEQEYAQKTLSERLEPIVTSETAQPHEMRAPHVNVKEKKAILYRITIDQYTGRYEKTN
jgi:hypothetical protein